jgi:hypothetical protein
MNCRHNHRDQCGFDRIEDILEEVLARLTRVENKENYMSKQLDDLATNVANEVSVDQSAITLIEGLAAQITAAGTDPVKLADLSSQLKASSAALAAAVSANTVPPVNPPAPTA